MSNDVKKKAIDKLSGNDKPTATSVCTACNGKGIDLIDPTKYCDACGGSGSVEVKAQA